MVHRTHALCLLARALAFDAAADDGEVAALALSELPREAHPPPPAERMGGLDAAQLDTLVAWFGGMFTVPQNAAPDAPPRNGGAAVTPGVAGAAAALRGALCRHMGTAEEVSALFVALCRALAVPARTAHALLPVALKPDAASLAASEGLTGTDPAGWHTYRYHSRREGARAMLRAARRAPRAPPAAAQPRQRATPKAAASAPSPAAAAPAPADVVDLTADSDGDGGGTPAPASTAAAPPKRRRGEDELERDTAAALRASLADASSPPKSGGGGGGGRGGPAPKGDDGAVAWSRSRGPARHWAEVYVGAPPGGAWVPVRPWERAGTGVGCAARCEAAVLLGAPGGAEAALPYVVACAGGGAKDVTQRYAQRWSASQKARADGGWWADALAQLRAAAAAAGPGGAAASAAEDAALAAAAASEALPRRVADYKAHPLYALERNLTRYQGLRPDVAPCGALGQERVFPRAAVAELHTASVWQREHARRVTDQHRDAPAKRVPRRGAAAAAKRAREARAAADREAVAAGLPGADEGDGHDGEDEEEDGGAGGPTVALYGEWQTEAHEPEAAADGRVPVNAFGNVDLMHGAAPPAGCTHVALPRAAAVARALGMHAPPALVGFERYAGRQVPVLDGCVVADEHAEALRDACLADERAREQRALQRATDEAAKRWRKLLAAVWVRRRVDAEYGAGAGGAGAAAAAPRAPKAAAAAAVEVMELDSDGEVVHGEASAPAAADDAAAVLRLARNGVMADVEQM